MTADFLDRFPDVVFCHDADCHAGINGWRCAAGCPVAVATHRHPLEAPRSFPNGTGRHEFTGLRCDHAGCTGSLLGKTDTRLDLRALVDRAITAGWYCQLVKGKPVHLCPTHAKERA